MADVYLKSDATGSANGTSWENAYTNPATAAAALTDDDFLYIDSPADRPFVGGMTITNKEDLTIVCDAGPNGECNWTNGRKSQAWTGPDGSGIFQLASVAAAPAYMVWDWKQDDSDGTVTGWALTDWDIELLENFGIPEAYARAYYGFMDRDVSTPTTPAEGKWGYNGTTLYLNPPSTPTLAQVKALAQYIPLNVVGIQLSNCDNLIMRGRSNFHLYANGFGVTPGYAVQASGSNGLLRDIYNWTGGWHSVGWSGVSGTNNRIEHCFCNSCVTDDGAQNPFVFYQPTGQEAYGGHLIRECVFIAAPRFRYNGTLPATTFYAVPVLAHSDLGVIEMTMTVRRVLAIEKVDALEAFHSITNAQIGYSVQLTQCPTVGDGYDYTEYPCIVYDSAFVGRMFTVWNASASYVDCIFDRHDAGRNNLLIPMTGASGAMIAAFVGCTWLTGDCSFQPFTNIAADDAIFFDDCDILVQTSTAKTSTMGISTTNDAIVRFRGNRIDSNMATTHAVIEDGNTAAYPDNFTAVTSGGLNVFGNDLEGLAYHANKVAVPAPRDISWWQANIVGASTDRQGDLGWGDTEAEKVATLRQAWLADQTPVDEPHRYRAPPVTRRFIARSA